MDKRYFVKMTSPEDAVFGVKTKRSAINKQRECERLLKKHFYALKKEEEAVAHYRRRIELLQEMQERWPK